VDELIADISQGITLEPGDIIATGTPAGVGAGSAALSNPHIPPSISRYPAYCAGSTASS
jgi:2-keto-4-pentenoate hydratase/2-oxohepta-3-ene-1,7-dioic acid hydratase in catechol pathway